jgi:hypothetical protein
MSDEVKRMLEEFSTWLRQTQILTKNIIPHNVVVAEDSKLKLIDGLGASSPLNIARFSQFVRRKYIEKRIKRMYLRVQWELSDKSQSWDIVETKDKSV